jgi:SlyX protein
MTRSSADFDGELARRLSEVESSLMFLQRTIDDLNAVILDQQRRLEAQHGEIARLRAMFTNLADTLPDAPRRPEDEKPPHY